VTRHEAYAGPLGVEELGGGRLRYEAEPGRWVPAQPWRPATARWGGGGGGRGCGAAGALAAAGYTVLAVDVALTGETVHRAGSYANEWFPQDKAIWLALNGGADGDGDADGGHCAGSGCVAGAGAGGRRG
jgi:hypothetical protein